MNIKYHNLNHKVNTQAGVTLMLAVLVLSAVVAVAFSLATIVFIEIKSAGDALRTEPAVYGTIGVTEEALFQYKRFITPADYNGFDVPSCAPASLNVCSFVTATLSMPGTQPIRYDDSPRIQVVPKNTRISLPMYTADDFDKQYSSVQVEMLPTGNGRNVDLDINLNKTLINGDVVTGVIATSSVFEGGPPFTFAAFDTTGQYDLILDNSSNSVDITVAIDTVRVNVGAGEADGLPFTGEEVLRIRAQTQGLTRTYQVRIPIP